MEDAIVELIQRICHWIKRKWRFLLYNYRGKKNRSFVDYAIAVCYENDETAQYRRDKSGHGEVTFGEVSKYHVYSNGKGTYSIKYLGALSIDPGYKAFAQKICEAGSGAFDYNARYDEFGNIVIDISCEIEVDALEKDARLYINGYVQDVLAEQQSHIRNDYFCYKKNHQPQYEYNINI